MPANIKNNGRFARPVADPSAKGLPGLAPDAALPQPPDASLSAAFRHALGGKPAEDHLRGTPMKRGQEIAKLAKADRPGSLAKGAPRKTNIGPRSGHK